MNKEERKEKIKLEGQKEIGKKNLMKLRKKQAKNGGRRKRNRRKK
jgi:hypothetical protein